MFKIKHKINQRKSLVLTFILVGVLFSSCGKNEEQPDTQLSGGNSIVPEFKAAFSPDMPAEDQQLVLEDLLKVKTYQIDSSKSKKPLGAYYARAFGGSTQAAIFPYLNERIKMIFPRDGKSQSRFEYLVSDLSEPTLDSASRTMALNQGTVFWFETLSKGYSNVKLRYGSVQMTLSSSRVGVVQLGEGYVKDFADPIRRAMTMIHEGRHSDCTGGISNAEIERLKQMESATSTSQLAGYLPQVCGHVHEVCPSGHAYAGQLACDRGVWGAYSIAGLYASILSETCQNCSDAEKQSAQISSLDAFSRLSDSDLDAISQGSATFPDMSSAGQTGR